MRPGDAIGAYVLVRPLGAGGMGTVWVAQERALGRQVALKLLHKTDDPAARTRFRREVEGLARVGHPGVVRVLGASSEHEAQPWVATELIEGQDLGALCAAGPLEPRRAAELVRALADALAAVHAVGVLHRDLKPSNVLVRGTDQRPVLVDFGLARLSDLRSLTESGTLLGTPAYAAPEQVESARRADERADVYGLGALLYHLLSARAPFVGGMVQILNAVLHTEPPALRELNPAVPPALEALVRRAMAKSPEERFPSARALGQALDAWLAGKPVRRGGARAGLALLLGALLATAAWASVRAPAAQPDPGAAPTSTTPARPVPASPQPAAPLPQDPPARYRRALAGEDRAALAALRAAPLLARPPLAAGWARVCFVDDTLLAFAHEDRRAVWLWDLRGDPPALPAAEFESARGAGALAARQGWLFVGGGGGLFRFELQRPPGSEPRLSPARAEDPWQESWAADPQPVQENRLKRGATACALRGAHLLVGQRWGNLIDYDLEGGPAQAWGGHPFGITDVGWSPDGRRVASTAGRGGGTGMDELPAAGLVQVWDREGGARRVDFRAPAQLLSLAFLSDDRLAVGSELGDLWLVTVPSSGEFQRHHPRLVRRDGAEAGGGPTLFPPAVGALLATPARGERPTRLWSAQRIQTTSQTLHGEAAPPPLFLSCWDLERGQVLREVRLPSGGCALALSPDGALLAVGTVDGAILVYGAGD